MPRYVSLIDWTQQGAANFKDTVDRYEAAERQFEQLGVRFVDVYWTLGEHDIVAVLDAPDDETATGHGVPGEHSHEDDAGVLARGDARRDRQDSLNCPPLPHVALRESQCFENALRTSSEGREGSPSAPVDGGAAGDPGLCWSWEFYDVGLASIRHSAGARPRQERRSKTSSPIVTTQSAAVSRAIIRESSGPVNPSALNAITP
jgi:hypothetical protein